jgi:hypothetical protein
MACADHPLGALSCNACAYNSDAADRERAADRRHRELLADRQRHESSSSWSVPSGSSGDGIDTFIGGVTMTAVALLAIAVVGSVYLVVSHPVVAVAGCVAIVAILRHWSAPGPKLRSRTLALVAVVLLIVSVVYISVAGTLVLAAVGWFQRKQLVEALAPPAST